MPTISVVVPVYKVEPYLRRCVDSILKQTYQDFELILVDDGSPDSCGQICEEYAAQDSRIHVIHQENGGLSAARNTGTDWVYAHSDSQWITYVDSDDWIHPETLEVLLNAAETLDTKISICGYQETAGEDPEVTRESLEAAAWEPKAFYTEHFINATVAWGKLYHKDCLKDVRYPVGKIHEDEFVTYRLLFDQEKVAVVTAPMYAYFQNASGITKKPWSPKRLDAWDAYEQQIAFFEARGDQEMVHHRYRGFLENIRTNLNAAQASENCKDMTRERKQMNRRSRKWIRRAWRKGHVHFWMDFDLLYGAFPLTAKLYRLKLEITSRFRR